jgi:hypothetical protein
VSPLVKGDSRGFAQRDLRPPPDPSLPRGAKIVKSAKLYQIPHNVTHYDTALAKQNNKEKKITGTYMRIFVPATGVAIGRPLIAETTRRGHAVMGMTPVRARKTSDLMICLDTLPAANAKSNSHPRV